MTTKRPWTEKITISSKCPCGCGGVSLSNQLVFGHAFSEADARLFAAAGQMYEALEAARDALDKAYTPITKLPIEDAKSVIAVAGTIYAALRAANPDAFASEGE